MSSTQETQTTHSNTQDADPQLVLDPVELALLKTQTGIEDDDALREHVLALQRKALEVYPYPCIRRLGFVRLKINKNRGAYEHVLALGRNNSEALLLDVGCCFGNDMRKIASDGFPAQQMIGSDLRQEFWQMGHELFRSTPESFPPAFLAGDVFDPEFLSLDEEDSVACTQAAPDLRAVTSLTALRGHLSVVHTASLFHLFSEAKQRELARRLAGLLAPRVGSMIFGCHSGLPSKGYTLASAGRKVFCHSPESWKELWEGEERVFEKGSVEVKTELRNVGKVLNATTDFFMMFWSVKRL